MISQPLDTKAERQSPMLDSEDAASLFHDDKEEHAQENSRLKVETGLKGEAEGFDGSSPPTTEDPTDADEQDGKRSATSSVPRETPKPKKKGEKAPVQLIDHLPVAREEAMHEFTEMQDNWYQYKSLGKSREIQESMTCDCVFNPGMCYVV